jgi:hypothetical protein
LTEKQRKAAVLLVSGKTGRDVAKEVNCSPETICHWRHDAVFEALCNHLRLDALQAGREALRSAVSGAARVLIDLMGNAQNEEVRRKAALDVLSLVGMTDTAGESPCIGPTDEQGILRARGIAAARQKMLRSPAEKAWDERNSTEDRPDLDIDGNRKV